MKFNLFYGIEVNMSTRVMGWIYNTV